MSVRAAASTVRNALPAGQTLPAEAWERRHQWMVISLWVQMALITLYSGLQGYGPVHSALHVLPMLAATLLASKPGIPRRARSAAVAMAMFTAAALAVHTSGGAIEAHFYFFVVIVVLSLYEDWVPFLLAIGFVIIHHGLLGTIDSTGVYAVGSPGATNPWGTALIHGAFVTAAGAASVVGWRLNEDVRLAAQHQSLHDPLVGLPNRVLFLDRVEHALSRTHRGVECAVIFIDLDRFKIINDSLGHDVGDELLKAVAPRLKPALRDSDTLARFGGDEFVVLCEDLTESAQALNVAQRLHDAFDAPYRLGDQEHVISASIGVAVSSRKYAGHPEELIRDADAAMYRAKAAGGNCIELFDEVLRARVVNRLEIEAGLRQAIVHDELILHYQPIVDLETEQVIRCEALVRWEHPTRGLVPPDEFIGIAEETGLILPLGAWVIETACAQMAEWGSGRHSEALAAMPVSVNLSAVQVIQESLVTSVAAVLERHDLAPERLICEITETSLITNPDAAEQTLLGLEQLGVRVALDDFGTGYSSLASLKRFPLRTIKLDRSFISDMTPGSRDAAIIAPLVTMAGSLGLGVVAEGVETTAQCQQLREMGCDVAQGYLFGRPVTPNEFEQRLTEFHKAS